jgi:hypothetical protein
MATDYNQLEKKQSTNGLGIKGVSGLATKQMELEGIGDEGSRTDLEDGNCGLMLQRRTVMRWLSTAIWGLLLRRSMVTGTGCRMQG